MKTLSGGQRRRLDLALGLVGAPDLIFLDEPTTGFDPSARRNAWKVIEDLRGLGKTMAGRVLSAAWAALIGGRPAGKPALLLVQLRHALRAVFRQRSTVAFGMLFPVGLVLLLPQIFGQDTLPDRGVPMPQFMTLSSPSTGSRRPPTPTWRDALRWRARPVC